MSTRSPSLSAQLASAVVTGGLLVACKSPSPPAPVVFDAGLGAATVDSVVSLVKGTADLGPVGNVEAGFGGKWIATGLGIVGSSGGPLHLVSDGIDGPVRVSGGEGMFICPSEQAMVVPVAGENPFADGADGCIRIAHGGDRVLQAVGKPSSGRFFCLEAGGATVDQTSYVRTQKDCRVARLRLAELPANTANDASIQAVEHVLRVSGERVGKTRAASCEVVQEKGMVAWWRAFDGGVRDGGLAPDHDLGFTLPDKASLEIRDKATAHLLRVTGPAHVQACARENVRREDDRTVLYDGELASQEGVSDLLRDHWIVTSLGVLWFTDGSVHVTQNGAEVGDAGARSAATAPLEIDVTKGEAYLWTPKDVVAGGAGADAHGWRHLQAGDRTSLSSPDYALKVAEECAAAVEATDAEDALVAMDSTPIGPTARRTARAACALAEVQTALAGKGRTPWR